MFEFSKNFEGSGYIVTVTFDDKTPAEAVIPEMYDGLPVTEAFIQDDTKRFDIRTIKIPRYLKIIIYNSDMKNSCLIHAEIDPENPYLTTDGDAIYSKDKSLLFMFLARNSERFEVPDGVRCIEDRAFSSAGNLREVILPKSLIEIGRIAFGHCQSLEKIDLENVRMIRSGAFKGCGRLDNIKLTCEIIPEEAFHGCRTLSSLVLENTKKIGMRAFKYAEKLREVIFPDSLVEIDADAFFDCRSLEKINLENVQVIRYDAFDGCRRLDNIKLTCEKILKSVFYRCHSLSSLVLENTQTIDNCAFRETAIKDPKLPEGLRVIHGMAFGNTAGTLSLPESVERVEERVYVDTVEIIKSENLRSLFCGGENFELAQGTRLVIRSANGEMLCEVMMRDQCSVQGYLCRDKPLGFDFEKYDGSFPLDGYDVCAYRAALFRVEHPYGLSEEDRARYERFLCDYAEKYVLELIFKEDIQKLADLKYYGGISDGGFMEIIKASTAQKKPEITAILLQKKNELKAHVDEMKRSQKHEDVFL